jgi:alpha-aminoadipate/glutamate carrier protein LysW
MPTCPECDAAIDIEAEEALEEGQIVDCPECGAELEVVSTNPLELDLVKEENESDDEEESW